MRRLLERATVEEEVDEEEPLTISGQDTSICGEEGGRDSSSITSRWLKGDLSNKMNRHFIICPRGAAPAAEGNGAPRSSSND